LLAIRKAQAAGFTESSGIVPDFPWAEGRKAEVFILPLVLIGGILPPGGSGAARFTESSGIVPDFPWAEGRKAEVFILPLVLIGGILPPGGSGAARFTESSGIVPMVFGTDSVLFLRHCRTVKPRPPARG
jgi:hypothetical protein